VRELHGIAFVGTALDELKRKALLFDHFYVWSPGHAIINGPDLDFLRANGLIADVRFDLASLAKSSIAHNATMEMVFVSTLVGTDEYFDLKRWPPLPPEMIKNELADCVTWSIGSATTANDNMSVVPICERPTPEIVMAYRGLGTSGIEVADGLEVALAAFPVPDQACSWQDILDFKAEQRDKLWGFRRFLHALSTRRQTKAEIRDDIEWSVNEYTKEMDRLKMKRTVSFMETYVISTVEAFESFKPSAFLKGLVSIKKRKIELLEGEAKASGRECAYVFDARKRFGQ
jgi:hypothetical protein